MAWRLTERGQRCEPIPGVPWRDMTDEEFETAAALIAEQFPGQPGALADSGFFEYVKSPPEKAKGQEV